MNVPNAGRRDAAYTCDASMAGILACQISVLITSACRTAHTWSGYSAAARFCVHIIFVVTDRVE